MKLVSVDTPAPPPTISDNAPDFTGTATQAAGQQADVDVAQAVRTRGAHLGVLELERPASA